MAYTSRHRAALWTQTWLVRVTVVQVALSSHNFHLQEKPPVGPQTPHTTLLVLRERCHCWHIGVLNWNKCTVNTLWFDDDIGLLGDLLNAANRKSHGWCTQRRRPTWRWGSGWWVDRTRCTRLRLCRVLVVRRSRRRYVSKSVVGCIRVPLSTRSSETTRDADDRICRPVVNGFFFKQNYLTFNRW